MEGDGPTEKLSAAGEGRSIEAMSIKEIRVTQGWDFFPSAQPKFAERAWKSPNKLGWSREVPSKSNREFRVSSFKPQASRCKPRAIG